MSYFSQRGFGSPNGAKMGSGLSFFDALNGCRRLRAQPVDATPSILTDKV